MKEHAQHFFLLDVPCVSYSANPSVCWSKKWPKALVATSGAHQCSAYLPFPPDNSLVHQIADEGPSFSPVSHSYRSHTEIFISINISPKDHMGICRSTGNDLDEFLEVYRNFVTKHAFPTFQGIEAPLCRIF